MKTDLIGLGTIINAAAIIIGPSLQHAEWVASAAKSTRSGVR